MLESLAKLQSLYQNLLAQNEHLKGQNQVLKQQKPQLKTYAAATRLPAATPTLTNKIESTTRPQHPTVFISAPGRTSKEIQKIMTQTIKPSRDKINIRTIRSTEKVLILETETEDDLKKINENLKPHNLTIEKPRKRNPLIIIYDIPTERTEKEITDAIYNQNFDSTMSREDFEKQFKLRFKTGQRNKPTVHHVAEVSAP